MIFHHILSELDPHFGKGPKRGLKKLELQELLAPLFYNPERKVKQNIGKIYCLNFVSY